MELEFSYRQPWGEQDVPFTWKIEDDRNFADVQGVGPVTLRDAIEAIRAIAADVGHHQCGCLVDVRQMEFFPTVVELKEIAFEFIRLRSAFRCGSAFVVSNDRHYSLGRFLAALVDTAGIPMGVFRDPVQAEKWLRGRTDTVRVSA
jgi:hypothetical protein